MRVLFLLAVMISFAQAQQTLNVELQAVGTKLMAEINAGLTCEAGRLTAQQQLEQAKAEVKRLKDRYEAEQK